MKKLFSIVFAMLILFSGMHVSLATHICGGEVAAMKLSFSGQKASCGMPESKTDCDGSVNVKSNCCHNKVAFYSVDKNYNPSTVQFKSFSNNLIQAFIIPVSLTQNSTFKTQNSTVFPPGNLLASNVSLTDICVFRI
jgi:hypothetical protein